MSGPADARRFGDLWRTLVGGGARRRYHEALDRAADALAAGRNGEALSILEAALDEGARGHGPSAEALIVARYAAASAALAAAELDRARAHAEAGVELAARHGEASEPPLHRLLELVAAIEERRLERDGPEATPEALERALRAWEEAASRAGDRASAASAKNRLGLSLARGGALDEARARLSEALGIRRSLGVDHRRAALESAYNLATFVPLEGEPDGTRLDDAATLLDEVLRGTRDATDAAGRELCESAHHNLGVLREERGDVDEARRLYERALALRVERLGEEHPSLRPTLARLARLEHRAGRFVFALGHYERALALAKRELGADDTVVRGLERWRDALTRGEGEA